jgi:hypothetical protein
MLDNIVTDYEHLAQPTHSWRRGPASARCRNAPPTNRPALFFCGSQRSLTFGGAVRQTELLMSDVYQADTPPIRDAAPTSPTITAEDVRTMMVGRILAAQAREHAAQAIAHAENMSVEDARRQVQQYEQQYRQHIEQGKH